MPEQEKELIDKIKKQKSELDEILFDHKAFNEFIKKLYLDKVKKETKDFDVFDYEEKIAELEMACDSSDHALEEEISPNSNYCYSYLELYEDELVKKFREQQYV